MIEAVVAISGVNGLQSIESLRNFLNQVVQNCCSSGELAPFFLFTVCQSAAWRFRIAHHHGIVSALANVEGVIARRLLRDALPRRSQADSGSARAPGGLRGGSRPKSRSGGDRAWVSQPKAPRCSGSDGPKDGWRWAHRASGTQTGVPSAEGAFCPRERCGGRMFGRGLGSAPPLNGE